MNWLYIVYLTVLLDVEDLYFVMPIVFLLVTMATILTIAIIKVIRDSK